MLLDIMLVPALQHISMGFPDYAEWVSWILSIYLLVGAVLNPVAGELADLYGKKKMLIVTLAIYTIGLTGRALTYSNFICLIAFRAMQRIGLTMFRLSGGSIGPVLGTAILPAPLSSRLSG